MDFSSFEKHESNVRSYCRSFPTVFSRAKGSLLVDEAGREFIDFFAGAGTLNYGHNNDFIKERVLAYLMADGITHGLDFHTEAKREFIDTFVSRVLTPRRLDYKLQFCGPTGTNAVEAALKLARRVTGRSGVFSFTGAYHGMSLGSLAASGNRCNRAAAGATLHGVSFMPYPHGAVTAEASLAHIERTLTDTHSGVETPAAILVETIQAEGGIVVAPVEWLAGLRRLCDRHDVLLVCDDIQVGCFRSGPFFSFERAAIVPDIVTLSKSISGYGLPMALVLFKPELDVWKPGEHTGTFRGNQLAFVGGTAALELAAALDMETLVRQRQPLFRRWLEERIAPLDARLEVRGLGMIWGLDCSGLGAGQAARIAARCFEQGLVIETTGRQDAVIKFLPPLTTDESLLHRAFEIVEHSVKGCLDG